MRRTTMTVLGAAAAGVVALLGGAACSSGDGDGGNASVDGADGEGKPGGGGGAAVPPRLPDGDIEAWAATMGAIHGIEWEREGEPAGDDGSEHLVWEGSATVGYDPADHVPEGGAAAGEEPSEAEYRVLARADADGRPLEFRCRVLRLPAYPVPLPKAFLGDCATAAGMEGVLPEDVGRWLSPDGNRRGSDERETVIGGARLELRDRVTEVSVSVRSAE